MTNIKPIVDNEGRYSITQTANLLGVHRNTIGNWIKVGLMRCNFSKINNLPYILGSEILRCWTETI